MAHNSFSPNAITNLTNNFAAASPPQTTVLTAADAIQAGDLVAMCQWVNPYYLGFTNGQVFPALPPERTDLGSAMRPPYSPVDVFGGLMAPAGTQTIALANSPAYLAKTRSITLKTGNQLHAWVSATNLCFTITDHQSATIVPVTIGPICASANFSVSVLSGGGFVLAWQSAGSLVQFATYSDVGVVVSGVKTFSASSGAPCTVVGLNNGNFAVAALVYDGAFYALQAGVYSPTGVTVAAAITHIVGAAGIAQATGAAGVALTGGGWALVCSTNNGVASDEMTRFFTFDANGNRLNTYNGGSQTGYAWLRVAAVALQNGSWAAFENGSSGSSSLQCRIINGAGVQTAGINVNTTTVPCSTIGNVVLHPSGEFSIVWAGPAGSGNNLAVATFAVDGTGGIGSAVALPGGSIGVAPWISAFQMPQGYVNRVLVYPGTGNVIRWYWAPSSGNLSQIQPDLSVLQSTTSNSLRIYPVSFPGIPATYPIYGTVAFSTTQIQAATHFVARPACVPIGVATTGAAATQAVTVQTTGQATLRIGWSQPQNSDYTARGGNAYTLIGSVISMTGLQSILPITGVLGSISGMGSLPAWRAPANAEITVLCSSGAAGGTVTNWGIPIYVAAGTTQQNYAAVFNISIGQQLLIASTGAANAVVSIREIK